MIVTLEYFSSLLISRSYFLVGASNSTICEACHRKMESERGSSSSTEKPVDNCEDENSVTMLDVLQEENQLEEDANAVLGAADDKNCTYIQVNVTQNHNLTSLSHFCVLQLPTFYIPTFFYFHVTLNQFHHLVLCLFFIGIQNLKF